MKNSATWLKAFAYTVFLVVCLQALPITTCAQQPVIYQPAQMQKSLAKFKHALEVVHPALYTNKSPEDFNAFYQQLLIKVSVPLTAVKFHNIVLKLVAFIQDGHTTVFARNGLRGFIYSQKILPFHVNIQQGRVFITRNMSGLSIADGSEVMAINGLPAKNIIDTLMQYFSGDGLCASCMEYRFGSGYQSFYREYPLIFGFSSSYQFVIRDYTTKEIKTLQVNTITDGDFRAAELAKYGNNLHIANIDEMFLQKAFDTSFAGNYASLKISRFFKDDFEEPATIYPNFYKAVFTKIKEKNIASLVIDLRGNGGGIGANAAALLQYLTDKPFVPTKQITLNGNDAWYRDITTDSLGLDDYFKLQKREGRYFVTNSDSITELKEYTPAKNYVFKGQVYVLIDGGTLSAAGMAAGLLKEYTNAVFVGQETGGYSGMSDGIRQLTIPGDSTDVAINIPLLHSEFSVNSSISRRGTLPDFYVINSIDDILKGRDAVLNFVLNDINKGVK